MINHHESLAQHLSAAVDKLSVTQTAGIGAGGSIASFATATTVPDLTTVNAYMSTATIAISLLGACVSLALPLFKAWLERRKPRKDPPS